jgi:hypothetical protein
MTRSNGTLAAAPPRVYRLLVQQNPRHDLARLWEMHLEAPFPAAYSELEEQFGEPEQRPEVRAAPDYDELLRMWGSADLHLYDTYVAGHISTVLGRPRAGSEVVGGLKADARLARYFEACRAEAADADTQRKIGEVQDYFEHLNRMLDVAHSVTRR